MSEHTISDSTDLASENSPETTAETTEFSTEISPETSPEITDIPNRKLQQLKNARDAKKRKRELKEKADYEMKQELMKIKEENKQLRNKKTEKNADSSDNDEDEVVHAPTKPVVVVKQKQPVEPISQTDEDSGSFRTEVLKVTALGLLGLGSWWLQNRTFAASKKTPTVPSVPTAENETEVQRPAKRRKKKLQSNDTIWSSAANDKSKHITVGKSGLTI